ncbi:DUF4105 domain-containing protein [Thermomonas flagellata]|uniref:lipoprotein N-acyltransferase Lnb domain-containing protein n=1 Tax=Thermomonas flagellata TaxID=2888524 RepID=UPI001F03452C|nr:DUF4105 domain-containing protein [Thermomonas flagellata]
MATAERLRRAAAGAVLALLAVLAAALLPGPAARAQPAAPAPIVALQPEPAPVPAPRIGVVTMGPGEVFWERFGHDAIVVEDPATGTRTNYNFGFFDLDEPGFLGRFLRGDMRYRLVALPLAEDLDYYRQVGRGVQVQWLDLDPAQARALAAALADNARPQNARYRYDYFRDNCSTRVRDALDRALGGQLQRTLIGRSSGDTWRSEALRLAEPAPWMWLAFDIGLGPRADRPLSRWELAFIPSRLAEGLRETPRADGRPLVQSEQVLLPQRLPPEPPGAAPRIWPWLLAGLLAGAGILALGARRPRLLAALALPFWFACGLLGLVLLLGWAFTDHEAMWANRNLLLFDPLCLLLLPGGWALLRGRPPSPRMRALLVAVTLLALLACLPLWLQLYPQRNGHWIALLLPIHAALARVWTRRAA